MASGLALATWLLVCAVAAKADPPAAPQTPGDQVPVYDVYVTSERDLVERVTTMRRISEEAIEQESARNLDEALVRQPSLVVRRAGQGGSRLDLRGLRTRQVLLLVDGVPLYSTEDGSFDSSSIPAHIIERIDVSYSNSSVLYGDGPMAGVLQVRTRSGEPGLQTRAKVDARTGAEVLGEGSVGGAAQGLEAFAAGRFLWSEGFRLPDDSRDLGHFRSNGSFVLTEDGGRRENSDREQGDAFLKLGYAAGNEARVDFLFNYRRAEYGVPWRVYDRGDDPDFTQNPRFERVEEVEGFSMQLSGQLKPAEHLQLRSWAYVTRQQEDRVRYQDQSLASIRDHNEGTALVSGGAVHGRYDLEAFGALRFAVNGRFERFDSEDLLADEFQREDLGAWSLGVEYELQPVDQAGIVLGYGHAFLEGDRSVSDNDGLFLAGAYYDLPTGTRLRGSAAHKLRFPSIRQLYDAASGDPDLESERCWCFELAVEQRLPYDTSVSVTGFWLRLRDFIERSSSSDPFQNRQKLRNRGFELAVMSSPLEPLFLRFAYSLLDARDVSEGPPYDRLDNRPRHKIDAEVHYTFSCKTGLRVALTWADDSITYSQVDDFRVETLDDFVLLDLMLEQSLWEKRLRGYVGVDNVLDEEWSINYGFPHAGRTFFGGLELRF